MTVPYSGKPATVAAALPTLKNIQSTTFTTPIVVTTTAPHGISVGEYLVVNGATDPFANFIWKASVITPTTITLVYPNGTPSPGSLAGGAVGTLISAGFGAEVPIISDSGDVNAAQLWNVPYTALLDRVAYLLFTTNYFTTIKAGGAQYIRNLGSFIGEAGSLFSGVFDFVTSSIVKIKGRRVRGPRVALAASTQTVTVLQGNRFILTDPAAPEIITLDETTGSPEEGETIEFLSTTIPVAGSRYTFKRPNGDVIAVFEGPPSVAAINQVWVEFELDSAGAWRLGANSGSTWDETALADYGVVPGAFA